MKINEDTVLKVYEMVEHGMDTFPHQIHKVTKEFRLGYCIGLCAQMMDEEKMNTAEVLAVFDLVKRNSK